MSTLRKYQADPMRLLNTALSLYRSKKIRTAVVEGICDKRFLNQWTREESAIRFDGFDGKALVENVFKSANKKPYVDYDFLFFFADVDYDELASRALFDHPRFIYNAFCFDSKKLIYNDLESFLVNTNSFEKVLSNLDIERPSALLLREKLEKASRAVGALRAADIVIKRKENLRSSVLNGLDFERFFDAKTVEINLTSLFGSLKGWANYPHFIDDLIEIAQSIDKDSPSLWSVSRGHDVTEMLSLHLEAIGKKGINKEKLEMLLRLACEAREYEESPMGRKLAKGGVDDCFLKFA